MANYSVLNGCCGVYELSGLPWSLEEGPTGKTLYTKDGEDRRVLQLLDVVDKINKANRCIIAGVDKDKQREVKALFDYFNFPFIYTGNPFHKGRGFYLYTIPHTIPDTLDRVKPEGYIISEPDLRNLIRSCYSGPLFNIDLDDLK